MVTIQKMNKETPRAMVRAAGELVDARGRLMDEMSKSEGVASGLMHFSAVTERSTADMPVVVEIWSMDTVKAV